MRFNFNLVKPASGNKASQQTKIMAIKRRNNFINMTSSLKVSVPVPDHIAVPVPEHIAVPVPEHNAVPVPEHNAVPVPEHNAVPVPEHNAVPVPDPLFNADSALIYLIGKSLITLDTNEYINVQTLYCCDNLITSLSLIENKKLINLYINNNYIEELNIENNLSLTTLVCQNNLLTSLNISLNSNLTYISCYNNLITQENADKIAYDILQQQKKCGHLVIVNQHNNRKIEITNNLLILKNNGWVIR
jgi:hypothetical protein